MAANRVETELLIFGDRKSSDGEGQLHAHLRRRLRHGNMAGVADLAMLLVGRMPVPMPCCLHGKEAHGKDQGHGQQS
jgi:hypothetical protein